MALRIADVPAGRGIAWVKESFALFFRNPLGFSMMFMLFLVGALLFMALPVVGSLLMLAAMPLLTLGFAAGTRAARRGEPVSPGLLFQPLRGSFDRGRRNALLRLCAVYAVLTAAVLLLAAAVDAGAFERLQVLMTSQRTETTQQEIDALLADPRLTTGLMLRMGLIGLLSVPFWHAPMLVAWNGQPLAQSLFSSALALWRNRGAFALYMLAWLGLSAAVGIAASVASLLFGSAALVSLLLPPLALMLSVVFYVSLYPIYADSFQEDAAAA